MNEYITETRTDSICDEHIRGINLCLGTVTKVSDGADLIMVADEFHKWNRW